MTEYTEYTEEEDVWSPTLQPADLDFFQDPTLTTLLTESITFNNMINNFINFKNQDLKTSTSTRSATLTRFITIQDINSFSEV